MVHLVTDSKWLVLRAQPLLDDILAILPKLSGVLDTEAMIKHVLDLFQAQTGDLGIEEVCVALLAFEYDRMRYLNSLQISTQPIPQIAA